jgi:hypothetical protein
MQNARDDELGPYQNFKKKVTPLARRILFTEALEPKFVTFPYSCRYHHLIEAFMKTPLIPMIVLLITG